MRPNINPEQGQTSSIEFTGERFVPGQSLSNMAADHFARYEFASNFVAGKRVLDIACGTGYGSALLAEAKASYVLGVDCSTDAINYADTHYRNDNLSFKQDNIFEFKSSEKFDVVVSFETIEHLENHSAALTIIFDLLKFDGQLIISSPNRLITTPKARNQVESGCGFHIKEFTIPELRKDLESVGFRVNDGAIYGQRQQPYLKTAFLRKVYDILYKPKKRASPRVVPVTTKMPRYFVIVARKR